MTQEFITNNSDTEKAPVDTEVQFTQLWESGDKIAALEAVMGRYINASEIVDSRDLAIIIMQPSASEAYAAALVVKTLEEMAAEK